MESCPIFEGSSFPLFDIYNRRSLYLVCEDLWNGIQLKENKDKLCHPFGINHVYITRLVANQGYKI